MPTIEVTLNLSDQELATAHEQRGAMPLDEFLSYCAAFGIFDVRDQFQGQQRDYMAQTMQTSMSQHQRSRTQREAFNVKELARKKEDPS
jgi:6-phosphofructokinase